MAAEAQPPLLPEAGDQLFRQIESLWLQPELARRAEAGRPLAPASVYAIQVVFNVDQDPEVRINEEVGGEMQVRAGRALKAGEEVRSDDITEIEFVQLSDRDPNAAHITAFLLANRWHITFDGRYNAEVIAGHLEAAGEFVRLAEHAVEQALLRGFVENAFEAAELLAKAEILALPDAQVLHGKRHGTVASRFNKWAQLGNTDPSYAQLCNELERLRPSARYLRGKFDLPEERARQMLATLKEMQLHAEAVAPTRRSMRP
jgi:hypothetical protein